MTARVGIGFDVHRFAADRPLWLGGVRIDHPLGLAGHSDADVLTHAIMDALLGAAGLGDIGLLFPDSDEQYRGIASLELLRHVKQRLSEAGFTVGNIDSVVICENPRIAPYREAMQQCLAGALDVDPAIVSVKGTTTEGLGFTGRGDGIAAQAVAMLARQAAP